MSEQRVHHIPVPVGFLGTWSCKVNMQMGKEGEFFILKEGPWLSARALFTHAAGSAPICNMSAGCSGL